MLGCTPDYTNCCISKSDYAEISASDEVDETSNTGPTDDTEITSKEALVEC